MQTTGINRRILEERGIHEPKGAIRKRKAMDNLTPESNLYMLDCSKYQATELHVKVVQAYDVFESAARFELMCYFIGFHRSPIVSETIIADKFQFVKHKCVISYNKSPTLKNCDLIGKVHGRFRVFLHSLIRQKTRPGTLFYGKRGEYCCYKYRVFSISTKNSNYVFDFAIKHAIPRRNVTTLSSGFDRDNYPNMPINSPLRSGQYRCEQ